MPKVTIDGQVAEFEENLTILQAAERIGIEVPHYCYHPGLSIAGNCRMCLVEVEKMPKLQIGCNTRITDSMVISTRNERVKRAQEAVLEFLLINHPIDCPICDQAGECKLQDYYMDYDRRPSRFPVERKVQKRKVVDIGPRIVLDQERCILCLRCTRFLDEITGTSELGTFGRGDHACIDLAPGQRLDNPYSENVVDICPVGALTSKPFRFQARVWYLKRTESICSACARGCNVDVYHRQGHVYRFRPRYNPEVNDYWMCDRGRDSFHPFQGEDRLLVPFVRDGEAMQEARRSDAVATLVDRLRVLREESGPEAIAGVVGAQCSNEEAFLFRKFLAGTLGGRVVGHAWSPPDAKQDDLLIRADQNPNTEGLAALGIPSGPEAVRGLFEEARRDGLRGLVLLRADLAGHLGREASEDVFEGLDFLAVLDLRRTETSLYADLVLPVGSYLESEGTFTNFQGRVQRAVQAFPPAGNAVEGWRVLLELLAEAGAPAPGSAPDEIFARIGETEPPFSGLTYRGLGLRGAPLARQAS